MKRLEGKIAIITGASAGIGKASALLFASEGASLGLIDINLDGGKKVCQEIRKNGGKVEFFGIDVSNPEAMKGAFEAVADTYGGIDVLYNNAGGATPRDDYILKMPLDEFDHAIGLNLFGPLLGCRLAIPYMNQRGGGSIINTASIRSRTPTSSAEGRPITAITSTISHTARRRLQPRRSITELTGTSSSDTEEVIAAT